MTTRALGVGPAATLITSGQLERQPRLILADTENYTADSTFGLALTELLRADLSQSPVVRLLDRASIADALERMGRERSAELNQDLALELAEREGAAGILVGRVDALGSGYVLTARIVSAHDESELLSERETAQSDAQLIPAVDELSAKVRERIGESFRSLRARPPLSRVATGSVEALRKYTASRPAEQAGDMDRAVALLREAVTIDTAFAMAFRRLAVTYSNENAPRSLRIHAMRAAYRHRDRLPDDERLLITADYHDEIGDVPHAIEAYRDVLQRWPDRTAALNNMARSLWKMREYQEAETLALRAVELGGYWTNYLNACIAQLGRGAPLAAESTLARFAEAYSPSDSRVIVASMLFAGAIKDYGAVDTLVEAFRREAAGAAQQSLILISNFAAQAIRGKMAWADALLARQAARSPEAVTRTFFAVISRGAADILFRNAPTEAFESVEAALTRYPLDELDPLDRPYLRLAELYAYAGQPNRARQLLAELDRELADVEPTLRDGFDANSNVTTRTAVEGAIALAEGRARDAILAFRARQSEPGCSVCGRFQLGRAYDLADQPDSALSAYEQAISASGATSFFEGMSWLGPTYRRLGELYESRDTEKAVEYYDRFIALWEDSDPELQPQVQDVRERIARLAGEPRRQ
jgi:tetratricopeptide (TPR) repeat protein